MLPVFYESPPVTTFLVACQMHVASIMLEDPACVTSGAGIIKNTLRDGNNTGSNLS